eukprot:gene3164-4080_t
MNHLAKET